MGFDVNQLNLSSQFQIWLDRQNRKGFDREIKTGEKTSKYIKDYIYLLK